MKPGPVNGVELAEMAKQFPRAPKAITAKVHQLRNEAIVPPRHSRWSDDLQPKAPKDKLVNSATVMVAPAHRGGRECRPRNKLEKADLSGGGQSLSVSPGDEKISGIGTCFGSEPDRAAQRTGTLT